MMLGKHRVTKQMVAIKYINTQKFSKHLSFPPKFILKIEKATNINMIHTENEMLSQLDHPNIVKMYNCYQISPTT